MHFGALEFLDEHRVSPGARIESQGDCDAEIVTYVRSGAVAFEDSIGHSGVIEGGEFRRVTAARRTRHGDANASRTEAAHVFRIGLHSSDTREAHHQQRRFSAAERRGVLCVVASPDARCGSLRLYQDAVLYSAMLAPGQHVVHELSPGRSAWLHVIDGEVTLGDLVLSTGDGAGVTVQRAVSFTAWELTEILLIDLGARDGIA